MNPPKSQEEKRLWDGSIRLRWRGHLNFVRRADEFMGSNDSSIETDENIGVWLDGKPFYASYIYPAIAQYVHDNGHAVYCRINLTIKEMRRVRKPRKSMPAPSPSPTIGMDEVDDFLNVWYADSDSLDTYFVKHVKIEKSGYGSRIFQIVAGFGYGTDGLYALKNAKFHKGKDNVLYLRLIDYESVHADDGKVSLRRNLVSGGFLTEEEYTRYFCCTDKRLLAESLPKIKINS